MKVLINTISKKIHTLVKENTPCCHKLRQECGFMQKASFFSVLLCFLSYCRANIGRQVRLIPPNTYQEIYDTHTCLNLLKNMSKCVFMQDMLKSQCKFITLLGKYAQQKEVGWEVIFSELGFAGSGACKPRRELEGSALDFFCSLF